MQADGCIYYLSWAGYTSARVRVLAETPKRYRVEFLDAAPSKPAGTVALVPKDVVRLNVLVPPIA